MFWKFRGGKYPPRLRGNNGKARSIITYKSLLECPRITALVASFDTKAFNDTELLKSAGGNNFSQANQPKTPRLKYVTKWLAHLFCKFHICCFLTVLKQAKRTAHMCGGMKTLKHNVRTMLRFAQSSTMSLLKLVCLSLSLLMHRMLCEGNLSRNIAIVYISGSQPGCHLQYQRCHELIRLSIYQWKDIFKMSPSLKQNCYGFATRCRKLYFSFEGCRKPKMVGNDWFNSFLILLKISNDLSPSSSWPSR